ncbi:hypothetical protein AB9N12_06195 [Bacteroides sp. AN502(2024)]|uniref:hypothetical protein n=1 Tax=Bacteroides sp. AN502(2024) TaxID=3160599 RepID=UPI003514A5D4
MKKCIDLMVYLLIPLVFYSCNGDVFVDDFRSSDSELALDGNGDAAIIQFASSNWDLLEVHTYDSSFSCQYKVYDADNNLIAKEQIPCLKGLGKIVCDENLTDFIIERSNPKELKIIVGENIRPAHFHLILIAGNEYEAQEISVNISPSDRYVLDRITYSLNGYSYAQKIEMVQSFVQNNGWDIDFSYSLKPYENVNYKVAFKSYKPEAFQLLGGDIPTVEIPSIENEELAMHGKQAQYTSTQQMLPFPNTEQIEIPIPPFSTQRISLLIVYEWFETEYTLYATHPKTGKQRIITGMLESKMPVNHKVTRENIHK